MSSTTSPLDRAVTVVMARSWGFVGFGSVRKPWAGSFDRVVVSRSREVEPRDQAAVWRWLDTVWPDVIIDAAALGGCNAAEPGEFLKDNLCSRTNLLSVAHRVGAARLLFLGSICIHLTFAFEPTRACDEPTSTSVGVSKDFPITELANLVARTIAFTGSMKQPAGRPNGTLRKLSDVSRPLKFCRKLRIESTDGLEDNYRRHLQNVVESAAEYAADTRGTTA